MSIIQRYGSPGCACTPRHHCGICPDHPTIGSRYTASEAVGEASAGAIVMITTFLFSVLIVAGSLIGLTVCKAVHAFFSFLWRNMDMLAGTAISAVIALLLAIAGLLPIVSVSAAAMVFLGVIGAGVAIGFSIRLCANSWGSLTRVFSAIKAKITAKSARRSRVVARLTQDGIEQDLNNIFRNIASIEEAEVVKETRAGHEQS